MNELMSNYLTNKSYSTDLLYFGVPVYSYNDIT